jgi:hypothetical protein
MIAVYKPGTENPAPRLEWPAVGKVKISIHESAPFYHRFSESCNFPFNSLKPYWRT